MQRRLADLAGSSKAGAQTALGQMLGLLLELGHFLQAAGNDSRQFSLAQMLAMWAKQSGLKAQPSTGLPQSQKRWGSVHLDTELQSTLLLLLLHHKLQRQQISCHWGKKLRHADDLMEDALVEAKETLGTLQTGEPSLKVQLQKLIREELLCFKLCGADLTALVRPGRSSWARDRDASTLRSTTRRQCEAWAESQWALPSISESE